MVELTLVLLGGSIVAYVFHLASGRRSAGWVATGTASVAWTSLTTFLVRRGLEAGHWPLTTRYEFALCFAWAGIGVYLLLEASWRERRAGASVLAVVLLVVIYAVTRPADVRATAPLLPVLRSIWLQVHVLTAVVAYGAFGVAAGVGLTHLAPGRSSQVAEDEVGRVTERVVALAFPWLTLSILTGAIWAQRAWGRYWGWDPKETWALATWLWYLLILHVRPLRRWRGRRLTALVVAGFGMVLFTFVGVPGLVRVVRLETLHGF